MQADTGCMAVVEVTERSTTPVPASIFRTLEASDSFWELVDAGTVSLVRSRAAPYGIRSSAQVGQAILEKGIRLVLTEKIEGSLSALLRWVLPKDVREIAAPSPVAVGGPVLSAFASHFLDFLGQYLRYGRIKEYVHYFDDSPVLRGRLDLRGTAKLLACGRRGRLAYRQTHLVADIEPNRLLALGLGAVETLAVTTPGEERLRMLARTYSGLFEDIDWFALRRATAHDKARAYSLVMEDKRVEGPLRKALAYARALVLHLGAWPRHEPEAILPCAYFLNLELIFEDAVREVLSEVVPGIQVTMGRQHSRPIFEDLPERYVADPDIVVGDARHSVLVADCKYKEIEANPEHSDVYQLLAHCAAFGCHKGLLLYPGPCCESHRLGVTPSGIHLWSATVRPQNLPEDLKAVLDVLDISASPSSIGDNAA